MNFSLTHAAKRVAPALALAIAGLCGSAMAQTQTPIQDWQIIEGRGLTDDYVYIGMTRAEAEAIALNGNCDDGVSQCTFRAGTNTSAITLHFNSKNKVKRIDITNSTWPTTRGAFDSMSAAQVHALYPGSKIFRSGVNTTQVDAKKDGYSFSEQIICAELFCSRTATSVIYKPKNR